MSFMELSLRRLRTLREVARRGGVNAAAGTLHFSPSAVSQQLEALAAEVGAPVLERVGRGVRLTEVGRVLVEHAEVLLAAEQQACAAVEGARQSLSARLTVGVFPAAAAALVPAVVDDLAARHPGITVDSVEADTEDVATDVRHGHLDLALLLDYPDAPEPWRTDLTVVPLGRDQIHLAAPAGTAHRPGVELGALADEDWILSGPDTYWGRAVRTACRRAGFDPRVRHRADSSATAAAMVAAGLGVTLVSDLGRIFCPPAGVDVVPLARPLSRTIVAVHLPHTGERPTARAVLEAFGHAAVTRGLAPAT
ncbi:LysR family transcriptional regulator [Actinomycetospora sp. NBRC 106375]|uniref:LysR family transcriptional regulator n=1 Tax=Actinomycetospora sp. NBRC 106375 TaxID=3032207 RepID=UPI0024A5C0E7|nr:LysR family transcriptional regulator [Actinomycetospora sp. NBRC 106375]GLZ48409.1 LysR family transcriptional regulator [Actinomycetospora sp. NBRC 106375]